jgi:hypothetical protein
VFSTRSVPRCYKQHKWGVRQLVSGVRELVGELARGLLRFSRCELLLSEARSCGRGQFGNPEEGERPPLEAATKQRQ